MEEIKKFLNEYGDLLDINQYKFFEAAENFLILDDYFILVKMLENADVNLNPKIIFKSYEKYQLASDNTNTIKNIDSFLHNKFKRIIYDFVGFTAQALRLNPKIKSDLRNNSILMSPQNFATNNSCKVDYSNIFVDWKYMDEIRNSVNVEFFDKDGNNFVSFTHFLKPYEESTKLFKFIPGYGVGWNESELNAMMESFIEKLRTILSQY